MRPDYRGFIVASATNPKQIAEDDSVPQFKMATVTSVSPLRVRYDNELSASPATPRNLVGTLAVGDRVRVTLHRRKIAIDGRIGGTVQPGVLIAGVKSAKTYYEKYPDGRLICRGSHNFPANANTRQTYGWTYPVAFVGELPHVTHTAGSTVPQNISTGYSAETLTSVTMEFYRTTETATGVMFQAEGRWK